MPSWGENKVESHDGKVADIVIGERFVVLKGLIGVR